MKKQIILLVINFLIYILSILIMPLFFKWYFKILGEESDSISFFIALISLVFFIGVVFYRFFMICYEYEKTKNKLKP